LNFSVVSHVKIIYISFGLGLPVTS
jgi:hypothetical protein